jgi:hypothetical protein
VRGKDRDAILQEVLGLTQTKCRLVLKLLENQGFIMLTGGEKCEE